MVSRHKTKFFEMSPELRWLSTKPEALKAYDRQWVGISGERVVAAGLSVTEVRDALEAIGLPDALITRIGPSYRPDSIVLD